PPGHLSSLMLLRNLPLSPLLSAPSDLTHPEAARCFRIRPAALPQPAPESLSFSSWRLPPYTLIVSPDEHSPFYKGKILSLTKRGLTLYGISPLHNVLKTDIRSHFPGIWGFRQSPALNLHQ